MHAGRFLFFQRELFACSLFALLPLPLIQPATAVPVYKIVPLGFDDLEHTRTDGYKYSEAFQLNEAGQVSGYSARYNDIYPWGKTAWLYNGATTINIGLIGSEHTGRLDYKDSSAGALFENPRANVMNEAGQVRGYSYRYGDQGDTGPTAWLYDGATTIDIGLTGSEHTNNYGHKYSDAYELNEAGQVRGISQRFNGGADLGYSAWHYNGTTTIDIGLVDTEYTSSTGYKESHTIELNEVGHVIRRSTRYKGGDTDLGNVSWFYNGATTNEISLKDAEHTRIDGANYSSAFELNEAGQVRGGSARYNGGSILLGESVWLFDGATTINIGLTGTPVTTVTSSAKRFTSTKLATLLAFLGDTMARPPI